MVREHKTSRKRAANWQRFIVIGLVAVMMIFGVNPVFTETFDIDNATKSVTDSVPDGVDSGLKLLGDGEEAPVSTTNASKPTMVDVDGMVAGNTGAASYGVAINVPPGTNGVAPSISISYNSQAGDSIIGYGWSLSGFGNVSRSTKKGVPLYTNDDVFMWNGQELVFAEDNGNYWTYHTKRESYIRIEYHDPTIQSSSCWLITMKNGTQYYYGKHEYNQYSRIMGVGESAVRRWALDRVVDVNGNFINMYYSGDGSSTPGYDTTNGDYYPCYIEYGKSGGGGLRKVEFFWEDRDHSSISYKEGYVKVDKRLRESTNGYAIRTSLARYDTTFSTYDITYETGKGGKILIASIEASGIGGSPEATDFIYTNTIDASDRYDAPGWRVDRDNNHDSIKNKVFVDTNGNGEAELISSGAGGEGAGGFTIANNGVQFGDVNGDGLADAVVFRKTGSSSYVKNVCISNGDGTFAADNGWNIPGECFYEDYHWSWGFQEGTRGGTLIDINGDGLADIVNDNGHVYLNNGCGWDTTYITWSNMPPFSWSIRVDDHCYFYPSTGVQFCDINGDGLVDAVYYHGIDKRILINTGTGFVNKYGSGYYGSLPGFGDGGWGFVNSYGAPCAIMADVNKDDLPDIIEAWTDTEFPLNQEYPDERHFTGDHKVYFNNGEGWNTTADLNNWDIDGDNVDDGWNETHQRWEVQVPFSLMNEYGTDTVLEVLTTSQKPDTCNITGSLTCYCNVYNADWPPSQITCDICEPNWSSKANLLEQIKLPTGGNVEFDYWCPEGSNILAVNCIDVDDGGIGGPVVEHIYEYEGYVYKGYEDRNSDGDVGDPGECFREYRGFHLVKKSLIYRFWESDIFILGNGEKNYYHQDDIYNGLVDYKETGWDTGWALGQGEVDLAIHTKTDYIYADLATNLDENGSAFNTGVTDYGHGLTDVHSPVVKAIYSNYRVAESGHECMYTINTDFDKFGNCTNTRAYGKYWYKSHDEGVDRVDTISEYINDETHWLIGLPSLVSSYGYLNGSFDGDNPATSVKYYYDSQTHGSVGSKGQLTKTDAYGKWDGTNKTWAKTGEIGYDSTYGNVVSVKDAMENESTSEYDDYYETYLIKTTSPLIGPSYQYYDTSTSTSTDVGAITNLITKGLPTRSRDVNAVYTNIYYDGYGRVTDIRKPGDETGDPTVHYEYHFYTSPTDPSYVKTVLKDGTVNGLISYTYTDGQGKTIQTKTEADNEGTADWITVDSWSYFELIPPYIDAYGYITMETSAPYFDSENGDNDYSFDRADTPPESGTAKEFSYFYIYDYDDLPGYTSYIINKSIAFDGTYTKQYVFLWRTCIFDAKERHTASIYRDGQGNVKSIYNINEDDDDLWWWCYSGNKYEYNSATGELTKSIEDAYLSLMNPEVADICENITTTMTYDMLGRKIAMTDPDKGTWTYTYDANGNLLTQTDAKEQTTTMTYDELNRVERIDYPSGNDIDYYYDAFGLIPFSMGRLHCVEYGIDVEGSSTLEFRYDERGRVLTEIRGIDENLSWTTYYSYDSLDRIDTITYPDGSSEVVKHTYDSGGNLEKLGTTSDDDKYVIDIDYDAFGRIKYQDYGNNAYNNYTYYDSTGNYRLENISAKESGSIEMMNYIYSYDPIGNITAIDDAINGFNREFTYDIKNRLLGQMSGVTTNYSYDRSNRIKNKTGTGIYVYSGINTGPHAVTNAGGISYTYDANGNMITRGNDTFNFNAEDQLATAVVNGVTEEYLYDYKGSRVKKTKNGITTYYINNYYEIEDGIEIKYYYANGQKIARNKNGTLAFYHKDHLGGSSSITDASGNEIARMAYLPYGDETTNSKSICTHNDSQFRPTIYGDRIVWDDYRNGDCDIYMYDLSTETEQAICTNGAWQSTAVIYGDKIVWTDERGGGNNIYMYDLATSTEQAICTSGSTWRPAIYGDKIVWSDGRNGNSDIYMYDLSTETEQAICTNTAHQCRARIYGDKIVWEDNRNGDCDIYMYDLSTSTEQAICTNSGGGQYQPTIYGDKIVWHDNRNGNLDIYMYDLSTSTEQAICTNSAEQYFSAIYADRIAWTDERNGNSDIYVYDLSTSAEQAICTNSSHQYTSASGIYQDRIVWDDERNGWLNRDIYYSIIPPIPALSDSPKYRFTGKEKDSTGLYYYGARYYDPELGRFISPDAMGDNYVYCGNNPVNNIDPSGNCHFPVSGNDPIFGGVPQMGPGEAFLSPDSGLGQYFGFFLGGSVSFDPLDFNLKYRGRGIEVDLRKYIKNPTVNKFLDFEAAITGGMDIMPGGDLRCEAGKTSLAGRVRFGEYGAASGGIAFIPNSTTGLEWYGGTMGMSAIQRLSISNRENINATENMGFPQPETQWSVRGKNIVTTRYHQTGLVEIPGPGFALGPFEVKAGVFKFYTPAIIRDSSAFLGFDTTPYVMGGLDVLADPIGSAMGVMDYIGSAGSGAISGAADSFSEAIDAFNTIDRIPFVGW